jgi:hypothetical protein
MGKFSVRRPTGGWHTIEIKGNNTLTQVEREWLGYTEIVETPTVVPVEEEVVVETKGFVLKDGSVVSDRRFDRIAQFDERSRNFPVMATIETKKPRSYTWRCNETLDQGPDGACVGFGVAHELIARPSEVQGLTNTFAKEQIYWEAQKIDYWDGGSYPGGSPFYEGTSVLAGVKVAHKLGYMEEYRWAFGLEELKLGVGYNGPAVIGVPWYTGMFNPDAKGYIHATGDIAGGHCVLVNAISVSKGRFTIHNSWGAGWGKDGEAYISFEDMDKLLSEWGEACFFLHRHNEAQPE